MHLAAGGAPDPDGAAPRGGGLAEVHRGGRIELALLVGGTVVVALGMLAVRDGSVSGAEEAAFRAVNDLPGWLYAVVWPLQQLGALVLGPVVAAVALVLRKHRLAGAALTVTVLKLLGERIVKALVSRERPATSIGPDVELRGDVHVAGESFVSGHAVLVAALAGVVTPYLRGRWRLVPWALVAAVMVGRVYVGAHNPLDAVCGTALGVAIAGLVNVLFGTPRPPARAAPRRPATVPPGRRRAAPPSNAATRHRTAAVGAVVVAAAGFVACAGSSTDPPAVTTLTDDAITVGSFDFPESVALAEVYSQGLEAAGYRVVRAFSLGPREFVGPALAEGLVELVPEYAGAAAEFHSLGAAEPTDDVGSTHAELVRSLAGRPLLALAAAPGQDANAFVVSRSTAQRWHLTSISDLAAVAGELTLGGPPECPARPACLIGLTEVYGARFAAFVPLDAGGPSTHQALVAGDVDVALLFSTDPAIDDLDLVELVDDRGLQPAENITPLLRAEIVDRWGDDVVATIDAVSARLTTEAVRDLDRTVAAEPDRNVDEIVATWWAEVSS
jgi:osmoprotectant transport system substrate-binding protein